MVSFTIAVFTVRIYDRKNIFSTIYLAIFNNTGNFLLLLEYNFKISVIALLLKIPLLYDICPVLVLG